MAKRVQRIAITCAHCGTVFHERASRRRMYCSHACDGAATKKRYSAARQHLTCSECGKPFEAQPARTDAEFCSMVCGNGAKARRTAVKRGNALRGKGTAPDGGLLPTTYPKLNGRHAHRVVAEQELGRPLECGEIVHHDDEDKHNYSPSNLVVLPSQTAHARLHNTKNRLCTIPGCGQKHAAKGLCNKHWKQARKVGA